jgi:hypothetical protein
MTNLRTKQRTPRLTKTLDRKEGMVAVSQKIQKKKLANKWSDSEYTSLIGLVRLHGEDWAKIASRVHNKTPKQCMQKFKNSQRSAKKGNWTADEDQLLLAWVGENGATKWTECSKQIRGRCGKQCRERWVNILNPEVKKGNWSDHEQEIIFQNLSTYMTSWSSMSKIIPGRTENSIKNYFYSSIRRLKSNPIAQLLKEVCLAKETQFGQTGPDDPLIREEIAKLNQLSQNICRYLLIKDHKEEPFRQFLTSVLFGGESASNCSTHESKNQPLTALAFTTPIVPRESSKALTESGKENRPVVPEDTGAILEVINRLREDTTLSEFVPLLKYLESQIHVSQIVKTSHSTQIRLPSCWNCKNDICNTHRANIKQQI